MGRYDEDNCQRFSDAELQGKLVPDGALQRMKEKITAMSKGRTGGLYLIREPVKVQPTIKDLFGGAV